MPSALVNTYAQYPFTLASGSGSRVRDTEGREYWDLYGGHAVALLGHSHPAISTAIRAQMDTLAFYSNVVPLEIRSHAGRALCDFAPAGLDHVFFCNSGAEANENALKIAIRQTGRKRIAALRGGFHGRTLLALSATESPKLREPFSDLLCPADHIEPNDADGLRHIDNRHAAVIVEPIQSMAGVVELSPEFLGALRRRCDEVGAMLIYDEIQTGMGRLGRPLAAGNHAILPDMTTLAKGIANGYPMGAVLLSDAIADRIAIGDLGTTFGGGPVACAALLAVLRIIQEDRLLHHAASIAQYLHNHLPAGPVVGMRGQGCLLGLAIRGAARDVQAALLSRGFITGTSGDPHVLRLLPPINTPLVAFEELVATLHELGDPS